MATAHSSASYTSYNMDADDADHMIYLESRFRAAKENFIKASSISIFPLKNKDLFVCRVSRSQPGSHHSSFSGKDVSFTVTKHTIICTSCRDHEERSQFHPTSSPGFVQHPNENVTQGTV